MPELDSLKLIAVDGPPGALKSTVARLIAERLEARLVLDQVDDNPFLTKFYGDMRRYALHTQISFLLSRYKQQSEVAQPELFRQKTVTNYTLTTDEIFAHLTLSQDEYHLYRHLQSAMVGSFVRPDVVIFLRADIAALLDCMEQAGEGPVYGMGRDYVQKVLDEYNAHFFAYEQSPVLVVEMDAWCFGQQQIDVEGLIGEITKLESGRGHFVAGAAR